MSNTNGNINTAIRHLVTLTVLITGLASCSEPLSSPDARPSDASTQTLELSHTRNSVSAPITPRQWWYQLSQSDRVSLVLARAKKDDKRYVGVQCKVWVQRVFPDASRQVVTVPATRDNGEGSSWYSSEFFTVVGDIKNAVAGDVVQMRWTNSKQVTNPHTFIVIIKQSDGVTVIDSNWNGDNTVRTHTVKFKDFTSAVNGRYTVYRVTSGPRTYVV